MIQNAANHTFDERDSGTPVISAEMIDDEIIMRFADDGCGMDSAKLSRIIDSFFTARLGRGGYDLGLSVCRNIATTVLAPCWPAHCMPVGSLRGYAVQAVFSQGDTNPISGGNRTNQYWLTFRLSLHALPNSKDHVYDPQHPR